MTSALNALANATATFRLPTTGVVTDPDTGNVIPRTETFTVSLFLKSDKITGTAFPGVAIQETVFDGYALAALDARVVVGITGTVTFAGEGSFECEVTGVRLPYGKTGLIGATLNAALGERIQLTSKQQVA